MHETLSTMMAGRVFPILQMEFIVLFHSYQNSFLMLFLLGE